MEITLILGLMAAVFLLVGAFLVVGIVWLVGRFRRGELVGRASTGPAGWDHGSAHGTSGFNNYSGSDFGGGSGSDH